MNVTIFSRSLGQKGNTIELGVIARDKTITTELIRFYSKGFKNLRKQDIDLERRPPKTQYEYFYLIFYDVLKSNNARKSSTKVYNVLLVR